MLIMLLSKITFWNRASNSLHRLVQGTLGMGEDWWRRLETITPPTISQAVSVDLVGPNPSPMGMERE